MFPSMVREKSLRNHIRVKKIKPDPLPDGPEQLTFIYESPTDRKGF